MFCSSQRTGGAFQPRPYERRSDLSAAWGLATSTTLFFNGLFFCPFCHPTKLFCLAPRTQVALQPSFVVSRGVLRLGHPGNKSKICLKSKLYIQISLMFPGVLNYYNIIYPSTEGLFRMLQHARQAPQVSPSYTLQQSSSDSCSGSLPAERHKPVFRTQSSFPSPPQIR